MLIIEENLSLYRVFHVGVFQIEDIFDKESQEKLINIFYHCKKKSLHINCSIQGVLQSHKNIAFLFFN